MAETFRYLLGPHGVLEGTAEDVRAAGYDPWQSQLFTGVYNRGQFGAQPFDWSGYGLPGGQDLGLDYRPGYLPTLLDWRAGAKAGTLQDFERAQYEQWVREAQAIPLRDASGLTYDAGTSGTGQTLSGASPDLGGLMLRLADKIEAGQATDQERGLFQTTDRALRDQNWRASVPQASDAFNPMGDNLMGALGVLALGATGGMAAAPLAAGGATLATTLGSLGTLAGVAGTGAGVLGQATDQDWLSQLGLGLGIAGGVAGGLGGLANLWGTGVQSLSDAATLAQSAGKMTGSLGRIPGAEPLKDVSRYLGYAGQAGQLGAGVGVDDWLGWSGDNAPLAANVAPQVSSSVSNLLSAADMATQRGGTPMAWDDYGSTDWLDWSGGGQGPLLSDAGPGIDWSSFTAGGPGSWAGQELTDLANGPLDTGGAGGGLWQTILGGLGGAGKLLMGGGTGASSSGGLLGPLLSSLGSIGGGAIGSNAANEAARLQAAAANRALSLQEAQWLQNQANQAPWMQAGREALPQLQQLAGQGQQAPFQPGATISNASYGMPGATPTWAPAQYFGPQAVNAGDYRWNPQAGPRAQDYRYTPGQTPDASQYTYTPGAVPTLSGQALLANDPGVAFRLAEGRKALEGSAAARGGLLSGPTLAALQRQGQELSSQEYAQAFARAAQQAQMREQWQQQATGQNFGQAMSAAQLREQVQQIASQQGWSQSQAEAAFREAMASQSSQQGFAQALGAQGQQWQQGFASEQDRQRQQQQFDDTYYNRVLGQNQLIYTRDWQQNMADYERSLQAYNSQAQGQNTQWNRLAGLAGVGQTAVNQLGTGGQNNATQMASLLGQLGTAQGLGELGPALAWQRALGGATNNATSVLAGLNR